MNLLNFLYTGIYFFSILQRSWFFSSGKIFGKIFQKEKRENRVGIYTGIGIILKPMLVIDVTGQIPATDNCYPIYDSTFGVSNRQAIFFDTSHYKTIKCNFKFSSTPFFKHALA